MRQMTTLGIDTAKQVFQLHGVDAQGARAHREDDLAPLGELDGIRQQVEEDLAQARHVADDRGGRPIAQAPAANPAHYFRRSRMLT